MPVLLAGLLLLTLIRYFKNNATPGEREQQTLVLIVIAVLCTREFLRGFAPCAKRRGYSSYLLPASVILFTYGWAHLFAGWFAM